MKTTLAKLVNSVEGFGRLEHKYCLYSLQVERLDERIESDDLVPMEILEKRAKKWNDLKTVADEINRLLANLGLTDDEIDSIWDEMIID